MCILPNPGLAGLDLVRTIGVGRDGKMCLVLIVPLNVAFNQYEHTPWLQALDELSDSPSVVCYLKEAHFQSRLYLRCIKITLIIGGKGLGKGKRWRGLTPAQADRMWTKSTWP